MSPRSRLVLPTVDHATSYVEALREGFVRGTIPRTPPARIAQIAADFTGFVQALVDQGGSLVMPDGEVVPKVPFTIFWLVDPSGFIGELSLRHHLDAYLLQSGGHIGYGVRPSRQRQGHGTRMLQLALAEARTRGIGRLLLTAHVPNVASRRIIERNGGILENIVDDLFGGGPLCRYWIDLRPASEPSVHDIRVAGEGRREA
jgi:predicted acetyltransferase